MRREDASVAKRIIELALRNTKAATITSQYERIAPGEDGRIRTVLSPVGTETGRFSSSDSFLERSTNLQNITKKMAMLDPLFDVRACIIAKPGYLLVEVDLSQAEARVVCAYADDTDTLALWDADIDVHKHTAVSIYGGDLTTVVKEQRSIGKFARHALNYGMGWSLFLEEINNDADLTGIAISAAEAKRIVAAYHTANPKLLAWWDDLWQEVQQNGYLVNAFGRRRDFLSPYVRKTDIIAQKPQSDIGDLLNERLSTMYDEGGEIANGLLLQVHDAIIAEIRAENAVCVAKEMKRWVENKEMRYGKHLMRVPADVSVGERWSEMEKVC